MRFHVNKAGARRTRRWFAWLPVVVNSEARWFEVVHAEQECRYAGVSPRYRWETIRFIN